MKKAIFTSLLLCGIILANAQTAQNPFSKYGFKKVRAFSFSKGEFEEFHDNKEIVEIGSVLYNTKTNEVVGYAKEETENDIEVAIPAISIDPLCEKYPWISPYAFCMNNPVRFIDPDGRDVWEINQSGEIVNRIKDKTQDAFFMVAKNGDGNYQRTYTTDGEGNKSYNSISFDYGTVTSVQENIVKTDAGKQTLTMFNIKGDEKASKLYEFMANPSVTTNVEWSHDKIGTENSQKNVVGTMHHQSKTAQGYYLLNKGYTIRADSHSHPQGTGVSPADFTVARHISAKHKNASFSIYTGQGKYILYAP